MRCDYCAFAFWTDRVADADAYVDAVRREISWARRDGRLRPADTLYVGGGTPSVLPPRTLERLIGAVELAPGAEVTVECNPESTTPALVGALQRSGVTRVSLGVQSLVPRVLASLGRPHAAAHSLTALDVLADLGAFRVSCDLVYGASAETDDDLRLTLETLLGHRGAPGHLSCYGLSVEAGTPLWRDPRRHPDDDVEAHRYELADSLLEAAGMPWYEVSNFARPGEECRHNWSFWGQGDYLGFGCSAHSHEDGVRSRNVWNLDRYLRRIASGLSPVASVERLSADERSSEALELAIRTRRGVPRTAFSPSTRLRLGDLLAEDGERLILTLRGRLLANDVLLALCTERDNSNALRGHSGERIP